MANKRGLLWIDVLGFANEILNSTLEESIEDYEILISRFLDVYSGVNFDIVSDSLLFTSKEFENPKADLHNLIQAAHVFSHNSFWTKSKNPSLRGSIVFDELSIGAEIFNLKATIYANGHYSKEEERRLSYMRVLGKAIVKAYQWESFQEWCLISINPDYNQDIEKEPFNISELIHANYLVRYPVPTKQGTKEGYVINPFMMENCVGWTKSFGRKNDEEVDFENFQLLPIPTTYINSLNDRLALATDLRIKSKLQNTLEFYNYIVDNQLYVRGIYSPDSIPV